MLDSRPMPAAVRTPPAPRPADDADTRERILMAAERLFARDGYSGTSLRAIMTEAAVNTASVHYHFGGKEALLRALFELRVAATNAERGALLDACEARAGRGRPVLRELLEAFFGPAIRLSRSGAGHDFNQITALASVDPDPAVRSIVFDAYDLLARRFMELLRRACPELDGAALYWKLSCLYGAMMYVRTGNGRVAYLMDATEPQADAAAILEHLVAFVEGGIRAQPRRRVPRGRKP